MDKKMIKILFTFLFLLLISVPALAQSSDTSSAEFSLWVRKIKLSGTLDGEFRWIKHSDITDRNCGNSSDLYIRLLDIGIEADLLDWVSAIAVLNSEWIGDFLHQGDDKLSIDEVHVDLESRDSSFYFTFGQRTQPFGLFETFLNSDPLTQDAYEITKVGVTIGYSGPLNSDLSITAYKGKEQLAHLFQSAMFDTGSIRRNEGNPNLVSSGIVSGLFFPSRKYLTIFGAFLSEPGTSRRNMTLNLGFDFTLPLFENVFLDGEYMKALQREIYSGLKRSYKEGALSVTAGYLFVLRERKLRGSGLYRTRRANIRSHPFEAAFRYEYFDDDGMSDELEIWSVRNKCSLGGRYSFYDSGKIIAYAQTEYRWTEYRVPSVLKNTMNRRNDEVYLRLGLDF